VPSLTRTVIIGAGAMGGTLARGWIECRKVSRARLWLVDSDAVRSAGLRRALRVRSGTASQALPGARLVLLAVKPQQMTGLLSEIAPLIPSRALVVSIAAGIPTRRIEKILAQGCPVVRVMPNTPALLGAGMSAVAAGSRARGSDVRTVVRLFDAVGKTVVVEEKYMDLVTAISGSGPAYVYLFIENLVEAGVKGGLSPGIALSMAAQTVLGAARMVLETGREPSSLREQVSSPGGTTLAGLGALRKKRFREALMAAVGAAVRRAAELRRMNG